MNNYSEFSKRSNDMTSDKLIRLYAEIGCIRMEIKILKQGKARRRSIAIATRLMKNEGLL